MNKAKKADHKVEVPPSRAPEGGPREGVREKRRALRFEKVFPVLLSSEEFGECNAMARNVSAGGILLEIADPLPLGTRVRVHFSFADSQATIIARGEVKNHYFLNYSEGHEARALTGMAVRFTEFEGHQHPMQDGPVRMRILH
jgi:hypothetical protein